MPVLLDPAAAWPLHTLLQQVQTHGLSWQLQGEANPAIAGIGTLQAAGPLEITFLASARYSGQLAATQAAAVIVSPQVAQALQAAAQPAHFVCIVTPDPYLFYARVAQWFQQQGGAHALPGVHPTAVVAPDARLAEGVSIGPQAVIGAGTVVGANTQVGAGCVVGPGCELGANVLLYPRVTLYHQVVVGPGTIVHGGAVIGADGFGFAPDSVAAANGNKGQWVKIPQLGSVVVGANVEIGANTTIDRGALDNTIIEDGVKLDDQIMIGHNVRIGAHTAIAACVGIAGSTTIGQRCLIGGAAMIGGHLSITDDVVISGGTAVMASIAQPGRYTGLYPITPHAEWQRNAALIPQLAQLRKRLRALERTPEPESAAGSPASTAAAQPSNLPSGAAS